MDKAKRTTSVWSGPHSDEIANSDVPSLSVIVTRVLWSL